YMRTIQQSANATARGIIAFNPIFSAQLAPDSLPVAGTGNSFADFLLGTPTNGQVISMPRTHYRFTQFEPYFQDSWKIRPGLTLNLGFAWHLATPPNPVGADKNSPHALDFTTGRVRFAALGDIDPKVYETDFNNVTPRIGLAWQPSFFKNTVVRAGWGVYFGACILLHSVSWTSSSPSLPRAFRLCRLLRTASANPSPLLCSGKMFSPLSPPRPSRENLQTTSVEQYLPKTPVCGRRTWSSGIFPSSTPWANGI
ncbi:MAG: hypothetical protein DMG06_30345, partial [Acidobacteria bacterium]